VRSVTDNGSGILWSTTLDPYGNPLSTVGTAQTTYGFTGEPTLPGGLVHLRARNYDPALGVFTSLDPFETTNRYNYVSGNPINYTDPLGLYPIQIPVPPPVPQPVPPPIYVISNAPANFQQNYISYADNPYLSMTYNPFVGFPPLAGIQSLELQQTAAAGAQVWEALYNLGYASRVSLEADNRFSFSIASAETQMLANQNMSPLYMAIRALNEGVCAATTTDSDGTISEGATDCLRGRTREQAAEDYAAIARRFKQNIDFGVQTAKDAAPLTDGLGDSNEGYGNGIAVAVSEVLFELQPTRLRMCNHIASISNLATTNWSDTKRNRWELGRKIFLLEAINTRTLPMAPDLITIAAGTGGGGGTAPNAVPGHAESNLYGLIGAISLVVPSVWDSFVAMGVSRPPCVNNDINQPNAASCSVWLRDNPKMRTVTVRPLS
jgi:RHS repeat-associated protein